MSGVGEADAAPAGPADPPVGAEATGADAASTPEPARAQPTDSSARVRPVHVVPGGTSAASNVGVPALVSAVHTRDAGAARAALAPTFQGKANGRPMDGDAQVRLLESFWLGFPDGNFAMEPTGGSGRHVITWTFQGTHGGMYLGVPPTGTPVAFSGYIIAVSDKAGVQSLDWKWDTKVFTRAVLGPDQVGDLEVKDTFRDPSKRWAHGDGRQGGQRKGKGKGRGPGGSPQDGRRTGQPGGRRPGGRPDGQASEVPASGADPASPAIEAGAVPGQGEPRPAGQGRRRRGKGRGPRTDGAAQPTADNAATTPNAPMPDAAASPPESSSAPSASSADGSSVSTESTEKPEGT
ncbi:MAG: ester cyclase [Candidatus Thermoplasmatota archaeon]